MYHPTRRTTTVSEAGPHITVGTVLHEFQEPVQQSHKFQFLPYPSRCIGKDPERRHPDPKGGRPRTGRQKLVENSELNDEGRIAKLARRYKFDEHQLPWKELSALGVDKQLLFENHCMGEMLKGRITSTAFPISKEVNGVKQDMGEACFLCVKGEDGKVQLKTLSSLTSRNMTCPPIKAYSRTRKNKNSGIPEHWEE